MKTRILDSIVKATVAVELSMLAIAIYAIMKVVA